MREENDEFRPRALERTVSPPTFTAELLADVRASIAEGPAWDRARSRLLWVDIPAGRVHALDHGGTAAPPWQLDDPVGAVVPRRTGGLVAAAGTKFVAVAESGEHSVLAAIDADPARTRFNDGKCDPVGRFWAGTQSIDGSGGAGAALYCLDLEGSVRTVLTEVTISNGLGWSPDATTMYYIDTPTMGLDAFDFDANSGTVENRRRLISFPRGGGRPDGLTVDDEGGVWVALFYAGEVRRYHPDGSLAAIVKVSAPQTTSCAFGGPGGETLFVTTACFRMPAARIADAGMPPDLADQALIAPGAGGIFTCWPGVTGPDAVPYGA
jgi:sugar lactone lactonase YvrE